MKNDPKILAVLILRTPYEARPLSGRYRADLGVSRGCGIIQPDDGVGIALKERTNPKIWPQVE
jgi:hypothetical protein